MNDSFAWTEHRRDHHMQQQQQHFTSTGTTNHPHHYPVIEASSSQQQQQQQQASNSYHHHHQHHSVSTSALQLQPPSLATYPHQPGGTTSTNYVVTSGNINNMRRAHVSSSLLSSSSNGSSNSKTQPGYNDQSNNASLHRVEVLAPPAQPLSRSSSFGSMLDWDSSMNMGMMMNTTPLPLHPKPTVTNHNMIQHQPHPHPQHPNNNHNYSTIMTTQSESSKTFLDFAPLPFNESSDFDGNTLSFLTSIGDSSNNVNNVHGPRSSIVSLNTSHLSSGAVNLPSHPTQGLKRKSSREVSVSSTDKDPPSDGPIQNNERRNMMRPSTGTTMPLRTTKTTDIAASLLHNTCKLFPTSLSVIESAVQFDPEAIHTAIPTMCSTKHTPGTAVSHDFNKNTSHSRSPPSSTAAIRNFYSFPLNIALQYNASIDVIAFLLQLYPDVLTKIDGPNQTGSLSIALSAINADEIEECTTATTQATRENGNMGSLADDTMGKTGGTRIDQLIRMFVMANPHCVKVVDRRQNTALHYLAKRQGCDISCESISMVYQLYPEALNMRNGLGHTPVQVAQRNPTVTDTLLDHWYEYSYREQEMTLEKSLIQIDHALDVSNQKSGPMDFGPAHDISLGGCGSTTSSCATRTRPTTMNVTTTTNTCTAAVPTATKASHASPYFVPSVLSSSKKNYEERKGK